MDAGSRSTDSIECSCAFDSAESIASVDGHEYVHRTRMNGVFIIEVSSSRANDDGIALGWVGAASARSPLLYTFPRDETTEKKRRLFSLAPAV